MATRQHRRANRCRRIQHFRFPITMPAQPHSLFRSHAIHIAAANAHRRKAQHPRRADVRLRSLDKINLQLIAIIVNEPYPLHASRVIATMPLHVNIAYRIRALAERCRKFGARKLRDHCHLPQPWLYPCVFQKYRPPARRHHHRFANETNVARTNKVVLPVHAVATELYPIRPAPSVAFKPHDLFHEIPFPRYLTLRRQRKHPRPQCRAINALLTHHRRGKNRLT